MKLKFKVGDRIRFVKSIITHSDKVQVGEDYEIIEIDSSNIPYKVENGEWFREDELELVTFTKSDLKNDDVVTYRNGTIRRVRENKLLNRDGYSGNRLENYNNDLKDKDGQHDLDIVKVERPIKYETVFERKEEILDNTEKNYLRSVIRPFRDRIKYIRKITFSDGDAKISIKIKENIHTWYIELPPFKKDVMYKNMEPNKEYSLEELGL